MRLQGRLKRSVCSKRMEALLAHSIHSISTDFIIGHKEWVTIHIYRMLQGFTSARSTPLAEFYPLLLLDLKFTIRGLAGSRQDYCLTKFTFKILVTFKNLWKGRCGETLVFKNRQLYCKKHEKSLGESGGQGRCTSRAGNNWLTIAVRLSLPISFKILFSE